MNSSSIRRLNALERVNSHLLVREPNFFGMSGKEFFSRLSASEKERLRASLDLRKDGKEDEAEQIYKEMGARALERKRERVHFVQVMKNYREYWKELSLAKENKRDGAEQIISRFYERCVSDEDVEIDYCGGPTEEQGY